MPEMPSGRAGQETENGLINSLSVPMAPTLPTDRLRLYPLGRVAGSHAAALADRGKGFP